VDTRRAALLGMLVSLGVALHLLEAQLPTPLPWVRLGLANLVTLLAAVALGWRAALFVAILRVVAGSLLAGGGFLGPGFILALGGGVAGAAVMGAMAPGAWRLWSPLGMSLAGAFAHGAAQLALVAALLVRSREALLLAPWVLFPALASGAVTGVLANLLLLRWQARLGAAG